QKSVYCDNHHLSCGFQQNLTHVALTCLRWPPIGIVVSTPLFYFVLFKLSVLEMQGGHKTALKLIVADGEHDAVIPKYYVVRPVYTSTLKTCSTVIYNKQCEFLHLLQRSLLFFCFSLYSDMRCLLRTFSF